MTELTVFYDGGCPLCKIEIDHLRKCNNESRVSFEDIGHPSFSSRFPLINVENASKVLHGQTSNGDIILALDVTYLAWSLVGKRRWVAALRWPFIRPTVNVMYRFFARYRHQISFLVTGKRRCSSCADGVERA